MLNEESVEDRQTSEFEALKAIYNEDLKDLRNSPWNIWTPLDLKITLTPQRGHSGLKEVHAKLDLHIICTNEYPNKTPKILLENTRGLSNTVLIELRTALEKTANNLKGEVMIFELANAVQVFLHDHNKPGTKSFYEEMLLLKKEKEKEEQKKKNKAKQDMLTEVAKRQEILLQENRLRKEKINSDNSSSDDRKSLTNRSNSSSFVEFDDEDNCDHKGVKIINFSSNGIRTVQRGRCLSHNLNSVVFHGLDVETGDAVLITEWTIESKNIDINQFQKQMCSLEQEMNYLVKLKHVNLVPYLNMRHEHVEEEANFVVHTLQEFVFGCNCMSLFICENIPVDVDMLQHIAFSVLSALDFLHRNNVVHKEVSHSCIYLNNKGIVKLSNYSLSKRLQDLILPKHTLNYGKKQDIFMFGLLLLSLIKGKEVDDSNYEIPINIPNNLYDFLNGCLTQEEKNRLTAAQLLNHPFLKSPLQRQSPKRKIEVDVTSRNTSPENPVLDFKMLANSNCNNKSRVQTEFEVLDCLGKGAYGEVFKVKNKLDQGYYAIKRIELNPKNKQLNKKIIREVKLLSKLNHENVVRYYNSWIESDIITDISETDSSNTTSAVTNIPKVIQRKELTFKDDVELLAPPIQECSVSYDSKSKGTKELSSSYDDSSDDDDNDWGLMIKIESEESDSGSIEFIGDDISNDKTMFAKYEKSSSRTTDTVDSFIRNNIEKQFMYIQMEFCEKSTLRTAIDKGLFRDTDRTWRLFREIVEGLAHIHQQGMIHRDLKPVNIFLDSNDHVKIGDFGLATTNFISKVNEPLSVDRESSHECIGDGSMTGHVGTALYVAPELCSSSRVVYNQKVDIYSLGIILFEMCYKPLETSMERIKILSGLRTADIIFPTDFRESVKDNKELVLRWLLNHCVSERPTSQEVLQSDHIPPPVLEECELQELVRHTLNNPHLKAYKYLVESCFKQTISPAQDITYDKDPSIPYSIKNVQIYDYVKRIILEIFQLHGGQNLSTPLLMPNSKFYDKVDSCTKLMTHSGGIVSIPHDLRVPFARYIAWNAISTFRRYAIERVYREKKVFGFLPRELYECAFDIVTPTPGSFMADAELIFMLNEFVTKIPKLQNKNFLIRLNHTSLIKAILSYCGIKNKHNEICLILSSFKEEKVSKIDLKIYLISLGLSDNAIDTLISMLELESPINKITSPLQIITRKKSETSQLAKTALNELKLIVRNSELFGVELPILIAPGLLYNVHQYSGMMCQLTCEIKKKNKQSTMNVIAAGGRYDGMIANYRNIMEQADMLLKDVKQSAAGISLSLDKIVQIIQKDNLIEKDVNHLDVVVCSIGYNCLTREKIKVLKDLWELGLKCSCVEMTNVDDIQEWWSEMHVPHFIILKETEPGVVRIRSWESDRFHEQKIDLSDLILILKHKIKTKHDSTSEQNSTIVTYTRADSKSYTNEKCDHLHENNVNILFVTEHDDKLSANTRRRYESQIRSHLEDFLKRLNGEIFVVAVNINTNAIRKIAAFWENDSKSYNRCVEGIVERRQCRTVDDIKPVTRQQFTWTIEKLTSYLHSTERILLPRKRNQSGNF